MALTPCEGKAAPLSKQRGSPAVVKCTWKGLGIDPYWHKNQFMIGSWHLVSNCGCSVRALFAVSRQEQFLLVAG